MSRDELKKRIEALNRQPMKNVPSPQNAESLEIRALRKKLEKQTAGSGAGAIPNPDAGVASPIVHKRDVHPSVPVAPSAQGTDFGPAITLEQAFEAIQAKVAYDSGFCLLSKPACDLDTASEYLHRRFVVLTGHPDGEAVERIAAICKSNRITPQDALFLDIETTGLGTTPLFLIGTMECDETGFHFRQYFARDYSEEAAVLAAASDRLRSVEMIVTFNGKSFDMPYIESRAIALGVQMGRPESHLDLLHESRRAFKPDVPNCQLRTLEQLICGRSRDGDIPGSEIPAAYHDYVRTGDASKIRVILLHNLYDLLTMADLMSRLFGRG